MPFQHITNRPRNIERHEPTFTELLNSPNYVFPVDYGGATFRFLGDPTPQDWIYASNGFNSTNEGALSFNSDSFNGVMFPQPTTSSQLAFSQEWNKDLAQTQSSQDRSQTQSNSLGTTSMTSTNLPSSEQTKDSLLPELHSQRSAPTVNNIETHERGTAAIIVDNEICDRRSPTTIDVDNNNEDKNYDQTWASRNPEKPVILKQQRQLQKGQNGEVRKIRESEQCEQWMKMAEEIDTTQDRYHEELKGIATKYDQSFEAIINLVSYSSRYKKHRMPSLYLAKVSAKAEEVNKEKCIGNKVPLARIREMIQEEEEHSLHGGLTREEEEALLEHLKEKREVKVQGARQSHEGAAEDCRQINGLAHHTSAHFVGFVSCSDIHDKFPPALITDSLASLSFFKCIIVILLCPEFKYECSRRLKYCQILVYQAKLTGFAIWMNYVHYNMDIIAQHHVQLEGWSMGIKFKKLANLKNLQDLQQLKSKGKKAVITGRNVEDSGESDEGSAGEGSEDEAPPTEIEAGNDYSAEKVGNDDLLVMSAGVRWQWRPMASGQCSKYLCDESGKHLSFISAKEYTTNSTKLSASKFMNRDINLRYGINTFSHLVLD
ncbi:hypothetical protein EDD18DRAFT_1108327 [Armillaria luteobubalina]|uniref:Uncharacterized protein n=1 Tax=Armillaria luteobubalina TaxID=153913 RepID=A0AA39PZY3_9AGAR|nr:hypothetical protein EDD18DRAFT_1108327 [Armillaria luteobubalina]